ncbi:MAG: amidohydrolase family protein [Anaerolineaceae bacterium]|nr:amidohydrolase family protein [Anaerolineaceae bacterium]MDE0329430.1 amidohydrolase family protein [Anaerolineaceae bacterium]
MERVDLILSGGTVVTMDDTFSIYPDGAVAIRGKHIVAVAPREVLLDSCRAHEVLDCSDQYILPGLVNAHTHVPMTLLRGLADDLRLDVWLMGYVMPTEREFVNPDFCRLGTRLACVEQIRSGITTFADMYYFEEVIAEVTAEAGMRAVLGQSVLRFPTPDAESYEISLARARRFIEDWQGHERITPAVAPHAPYSSTRELLEQCTALALEFDAPLLIHIAETRQELEDSLKQHGRRVVEQVAETGLLQAKVLAAHCVHIDPGEMRALKAHDCSIAHCPTSNLKLASGIAPVSAMLNAGIAVGIGTDGPASNNDLDMLEEVRLAAILAKTAANDPTTLPARQALLMATRQGAEALFLGDQVGSLEPGKLADVVVMDARRSHNMPQFGRSEDAVYSQIVYAAKSTDVAHVICHGRWLMRERELLTLVEAELLEQAQTLASSIDDFLRANTGDVLSKLLTVTQGMERGESFEVQAKLVLQDGSALAQLLGCEDVDVLKEVHYRQYDTWFSFEDESDGRLRYREDDELDLDGQVVSTRSRLTLMRLNKIDSYGTAVRLSHSRFYARADRPLRFYREYFRPSAERALEKDRRRWHIHYQGVLFYINVDRFTDPPGEQTYLELKSRTWSAEDAKVKAARIADMLEILGADPKDTILADYPEMHGV